MEFFENLLSNVEMPLFSAFLLGIMTAISPCPLATNITAIGFISQNIENRKKVFYSGLIYTAGRAITYVLIGLLFYFGASKFYVQGFVQQWGEKLLGPMLIIIGIFMLDFIKLNFTFFNKFSEKFEEKSKKSYLGVLLLGIIFALAFCPYSGVLYFGMLIPMTVSSASGLYLPLIFAVATGIPVIIFAWIIAFAVGNLGKMYDKIKTFEKYFRRVVAVLFIVVGIYYSLIYLKIL